jgi:transcriptional regulator with XRE-family HTH domain
MKGPREDWARLASYTISARKNAGYSTRRSFAAAIGVSDRTLAKLESGERVSPDTLAAVAAEAGWTPDSPRRILAGREPVPSSAVPGASRVASLRPAREPRMPSEDDADEVIEALIAGDEMLQALWGAPDPKGPEGRLLAREKRLALMRAWLSADPRRLAREAEENPGEAGTALPIPSRGGKSRTAG